METDRRGFVAYTTLCCLQRCPRLESDALARDSERFGRPSSTVVILFTLVD
jgi:hypothetical protein